MNERIRKELKLFLKFYIVSVLGFFPIFVIGVILLTPIEFSLNEFFKPYENIIASFENTCFFIVINTIPYLIYLLQKILRLIFQKYLLQLRRYKEIYKDKLFLILSIILISIHTYLLLPKFYILSWVIRSRDSAYFNGIHIIVSDIPWAVLFILLSYIFLVFCVYLITYMLKYRREKVLNFSTIIIILYSFIIFFNTIYYANAWFENTFTTEMRNVWGPIPFNDSELIRGSIEVYGPIKIDCMRNENVERFEKIFSELDTDDWILTTLFLSPSSTHWESHPYFLFLDTNEINRLESFPREYLNFLFWEKIKHNNVPEIYNSHEEIYDIFWNYIYNNSCDSDSIAKLKYYAKIDSLIQMQ